MSEYHYQISINGEPPKYYDSYPSLAWKRIAAYSENRSIKAKLERRLISKYHPGIEKLFDGFQVDDLYVSKWETFAEIESI